MKLTRTGIGMLIGVLIIAFLVAYILGLVIVGTVDNRLSDISINMPEIKLPHRILADGSTYYRIMPPFQSGGAKNVKANSRDRHARKKEHDEAVSEQKKGIPNLQADLMQTSVCKLDSPRGHYQSKQFKSEITGQINRIPSTPSEHPIMKSLQVAYPHADQSDQKNISGLVNPNSALVPTYYLDPAGMTVAQRIKFKKHAKFSNMTVLDFENWLMLYRKDPENLPNALRPSLRRLLKGERLTSSDIPKDILRVPPTAEQSFGSNIRLPEDPVPESETGGMINAANFEDYDQYMPPKNMKHLAHINPDEPDKFKSPFLECMRPAPASTLLNK